jgi:hypothetical protein
MKTIGGSYIGSFAGRDEVQARRRSRVADRPMSMKVDRDCSQLIVSDLLSH